MLNWLGCISNVNYRQSYDSFACPVARAPAAPGLLLGFDRSILLNT